MKHCRATFELEMRKFVKSRITWWDAVIEIPLKEIESFLTMLWFRMKFIRTIIWPKMWLSSLHCCQFVLICVILSCTKGSEIDQAVKRCPIISLGLGGHDDTITMMNAQHTLKLSQSPCLLFHWSTILFAISAAAFFCVVNHRDLVPMKKHQEIMEGIFWQNNCSSVGAHFPQGSLSSVIVSSQTRSFWSVFPQVITV